MEHPSHIEHPSANQLQSYHIYESRKILSCKKNPHMYTASIQYLPSTELLKEKELSVSCSKRKLSPTTIDDMSTDDCDEDLVEDGILDDDEVSWADEVMVADKDGVDFVDVDGGWISPAGDMSEMLAVLEIDIIVIKIFFQNHDAIKHW